MKWVALFDKLGKQPLYYTNHQDVVAVLDFGDGKGCRKIPLTLKFDKRGCPYLAKDDKVKIKE